MARKPALEVVTWLDHAIHYGEDLNPKKLSGLVKRHSVGWVVRETSTVIYLAHTRQPGSVADVCVIAKALVTKRHKAH